MLYRDGSVFTNLDGEPHEAPRSGVMQTFYASEATGVSVEPSRVGVWVWRGMWMGLDSEWALHDYMVNEWPILALFGRTVRDEVWEGEVLRLSREIMGEPKSAWRLRERRY